MSIEELRDLVIVILGLTATLFLILLGVLAVLLYIRIRAILRVIEHVTCFIEDRIVNRIEAFFDGIKKGIYRITKSFRKSRNKEEKK